MNTYAWSHKTHSETSTYGQSHRTAYTEGQHSHKDQLIDLLTLEIPLREQEMLGSHRDPYSRKLTQEPADPRAEVGVSLMFRGNTK